MGTFSIWHWVIVLFWVFVVGFPVARILQRLGMSGWWAILAFVPLANLAALWVLAYVDWPRDREA